MLNPSQSCYYEFESFSSPSLVNVMDGGDNSILSSSSSKEAGQTKSTPACKSHKEAERRRRQRINNHFSTLRSLLPSTIKTDKASLLAEVIHHVKELRDQAANLVARQDCGSQDGSDDDWSWPFPGEMDEATLSCFDGGSDVDGEAKNMMRVSICCEDRPGLNRDLTQAIKSVRARAVRAEMMTVGGRTKSVVQVQWARGRGGDDDVVVLKRALKAVVENPASDSGMVQAGHGRKRARVNGSVRDGFDEFF